MIKSYREYVELDDHGRKELYDELVQMVYDKHGYISPAKTYFCIKEVLNSVVLGNGSLTKAINYHKKYRSYPKGEVRRVEKIVRSVLPKSFFGDSAKYKYAQENPYNWREAAEKKRLDDQLELHWSMEDKHGNISESSREESRTEVGEDRKGRNRQGQKAYVPTSSFRVEISYLRVEIARHWLEAIKAAGNFKAAVEEKASA